jgi:hypothetical protein
MLRISFRQQANRDQNRQSAVLGLILTTTAATSIEGLDSPGDVLDFARWCRSEADRFEAN